MAIRIDELKKELKIQSVEDARRKLVYEKCKIKHDGINWIRCSRGRSHCPFTADRGKCGLRCFKRCRLNRRR